MSCRIVNNKYPEMEQDGFTMEENYYMIYTKHNTLITSEHEN